VILFLFFCSGAAALVYEVLWSNYLTLLFGSTIQAQTVVLAVFMGGLALGNKFFGARADRTLQPLKIYGGLEITIGLFAFLFPIFYWAADKIFVFAGSRILAHSGWLLLLKGILSVGLLGAPTIFMGGTLPVLAAWLQRNTTDAGRRSARFYSTNSLGAVCGAGLAGFFLIPNYGMALTMNVAALANVLIGLVALAIAQKRIELISAGLQNSEIKKEPSRKERQRPARAKQSSKFADESSALRILRWACAMVALTGAVSMGLEILASRCLSLIFGSSLQAFAIVLMAFILGIGVGSAVIASPRFNRWSKKGATVFLLLVASIFVGVVVFNFVNLVEIYRHVRVDLNATPVGWRAYLIFISLMSLGVLGLPAAALGAVLPLCIRIVSEASPLLGDRVGRLLVWNTLGAVAGVLLAGFVLMPQIGLRGSFTSLALVAAAAAIFIALATRQKIGVALGTAAGIFLIFVSATGGEGWRYAMTAGVFRIHETAPLIPIMERAKEAHLLFYEDAADATVSVERDPDSELVLRINGKGDASSHGDLSTQILLGQLPLMMKPDAKDVFCFGLGSGITAGTTLGWPIEHLTVAENCRPVMRAAELFDPWNHGVLTNNRVRIFDEDARTVLKLSPQKYDVIISEPSNPWMVNVGRVFSLEFYQLAASRLKPGGIMTQWFHTYETDDATFDLVLRTFAKVFPAMEIWDTGGGDVVLLGSDRPWNSNPQIYHRAFELPQPRHDLESIGLRTPEEVWARQFASQQTAFAIPNPGPLQRDNFQRLEYAAPRALFIDSGRQAERLQSFDERTWQLHLAPPEKDRGLAQLGDADLASVFGEFPSVDPGLQQFVRARVEGTLSSDDQLRSLPCIFRGTNETAVFSAPDAPEIFRRLADADAQLENSPADQPQAVDEIKNLLDSVQNYNPQSAGWSAAYYASLAAEVSLRLGNVAEAKAILLRGRQLDPNSDELNYLARIYIHDGILPPASHGGE